MLKLAVLKLQNKSLPVPIVVAADDAYVYPLIVASLSAQRCTKQRIEFIVAFDKLLLSTDSKQTILEIFDYFNISFSFLEIKFTDSRWNKEFSNYGHFGRMCYIKLLLPESVNSIFLWMDSDTLTVGALDELLGESYVSEEFTLSAVLKNDSTYKWKKNSAIRRAGTKYFNAGIMLINSSKWLEQKLDFQWKKIIVNYEKYAFDWGDQDVLNFLFLKNEGFLPMPEPFNTSCGDEINVPNPKILHFLGSEKPWHRKYFEFDDLSGHYKDYLNFETWLFSILKKEEILLNKIVTLRESLVRDPKPQQQTTRTSLQKIKSKTRLGFTFLFQLSREILDRDIRHRN